MKLVSLFFTAGVSIATITTSGSHHRRKAYGSQNGYMVPYRAPQPPLQSAFTSYNRLENKQGESRFAHSLP